MVKRSKTNAKVASKLGKGKWNHVGKGKKAHILMYLCVKNKSPFVSVIEDIKILKIKQTLRYHTHTLTHRRERDWENSFL